MRSVRDTPAMSLGIGVAAASMVVHRIVLQCRFLVNDDPAMMLAADGSLWGRPSADLVFINPALGGVIALLARMVPGVPWYLVVLDSAMFVTLASAVYMWRRQLAENANHEWVLFAAFMVSVQAWIWVNVSFTVTSILTAAIGALLIAHRPDETGRSALLRRLLGGVMIGLAVWLRWAGALGALVVVTPYVVVMLGVRPRWRSVMPGLVVVTLMVCSGAGVTWIRYHGSQDWHDYFEYNAARVQIHDTARRFHLNEDAVLESTGWSRNDARMFANWYFPDRETFSIESVKAAVDSSSGHTGFGDAVSLSWRTQYKRLVVAAAASIVVTALVLSKGRSRLALAGLTGWMLSVSLALATIRKLPARVALAFVFLVAFAAIIQQRPTLAVRRSVSRWVLAITAFIGLLTAVDILAGQSRIRDHHADFRSVAAGMSDATSAGDLVVAWAGAYRGHWVDPRSSGDSLPVDLLPMGWQTFSPPWVELAASHGISDVTSSISTDPSVYLAVDRTAVVDDKSFERFASEHLGIEGRLRPVARLGRDGSIELADIEVQVTVDYDRQQIVEAGLDGSETRRSLTEAPASAWMLSENRWPYDILGWVDTQTAGPVVDPSEWDLSTPGSILPPVTPGRGDVWAAVLYDGRVSDLELAVPDPDVPGRWWFDARVRGGEPGLWSVYLLNGDSAHPVTELPAAQQ